MVDFAIVKILEFVDDDQRKTLIRTRFERLRAASMSPDSDEVAEDVWKSLRKNNECSREDRREQLGALIKTMACRSNDDDYRGSPYVAQAVAESRLIETLGDDAADVAKFLLDPNTCPGAANMREKSLAQLKSTAAKTR